MGTDEKREYVGNLFALLYTFLIVPAAGLAGIHWLAVKFTEFLESTF